MIYPGGNVVGVGVVWYGSLAVGVAVTISDAAVDAYETCKQGVKYVQLTFIVIETKGFVE